MSQASQELLPLVLALWKMFHRGGRFLEAAVIVAEGTVSASLLTSLVQLIERSLHRRGLSFYVQIPKLSWFSCRFVQQMNERCGVNALG